jgi:DNA replication protein DnaC
VGSEKCTCLRKAEASFLYSQSNLGDILDKENFSAFSFDYYSDSIINASTGLNARQTAQIAFEAANSFVRTFDDSFQNLFLYGDTGVGKTFLSHCIAGELLQRAHSVLYFSAQELFEKLAGFAFSRDAATGCLDDILQCDLLIIDDLGTEFTNAFVASQLFSCISERELNRHPTIISTNLSLKEMQARYSDRVFSRITSTYEICKLTGRDIRLQRRRRGRRT